MTFVFGLGVFVGNLLIYGLLYRDWHRGWFLDDFDV